MNSIKLSIIMSEYNTPDDIFDKAVISILEQDYKDYEFIIVNDGNKDLKEYIKKFNDKRIKVINNESNLGLAKSLNKAIDIAKGEYIARMDTDDICLQGRLSKQISFLDSKKEYCLVSGNANLIDEKDNVYGRTNGNGEVKKEQLCYNSCFIHPTVMFRKKDIVKVGKYPLKNRCEDYALWCELYQNGYKGYIMNEVFLNYRVSLNDYNKRKLKTRYDAIKVRNNYCKKMKVNIFKRYIYIIKMILPGIVPNIVIQTYHKNKFKVKKVEKDE